MNRAEERAFAYQRELGMIDSVNDDHIVARRMGFYDGYTQAEKDTIDRATEWLKANAEKYIVDLTPTYPDAPQELIIGGRCWIDFRKAMRARNECKSKTP